MTPRAQSPAPRDDDTAARLAKLRAEHDQVTVEHADDGLVVTCIDFDADLSPTSTVHRLEREAA